MKDEALFIDLLNVVEKFINEESYNPRMASSYRNAFVLLKKLVADEMRYSRENLRVILEKAEEFESLRVISAERLRYSRKILEYVETAANGGVLHRKRVKNHNLPRFSFEFEDVIRDFECSRRENGCRPATLDNGRGEVRFFLLCVQDELNSDFSLITPTFLTNYIAKIVERRRLSLQNGIDSLRNFVRFLAHSGRVSDKCLHTLEIKSSRHKNIKLGFSPEESDRILAAVDRITPVGKRDYAALLIGRYMGVRGVDVFALRLTDIDWANKTVSFTQSKTLKGASMPLPTKVSNALADYILNARPKTEEQNIFLWARPPYCKLGGTNGKTLVAKYAKLAGLEFDPFEKGFHAFRRGLGVALLNSGEPREMISEVLCHSSKDALKPYVPVDLTGLTECPLSFSRFTSQACGGVI